MANLNNQGKRKDQYENSAKFAWYAFIGLIVLFVITTLLSGCVTTKKAEHPTILKETQLNGTVDKCCSTQKTSTK
jgi:uncharacterized membrane protein SpoIIM required for sporulation